MAAERLTTDSGPLYLESKVAEKLGVQRERVTAIRKQLPQKNFGLLGREIVLTQSGLAQLLEVIRATDQSLELPIEFSDCLAGDEKKETPAELEVFRIEPNERWLVAVAVAGEHVRVRVPSNLNFVPKMKLHAEPSSDGDFYELVGRCPRKKGAY